MTGWKIQLAAAPTQIAALAILDKARNAGSPIVANAAPYTEPVEKGSIIMETTNMLGQHVGVARRIAEANRRLELFQERFLGPGFRRHDGVSRKKVREQLVR